MFVRVTPDEITQNADGFFIHSKHSIAPSSAKGNRGIFCIVTSWCKFCHLLKDEIQLALKRREFPVFYMIGDESLKSEWKMKDMEAKSYPTVYTVSDTGKLSLYSGKRDSKSLLEVV